MPHAEDRTFGSPPDKHTVHFYRTDEALYLEVANHFRSVLEKGGSAVIIATRDHRDALFRILEGAGIDVPSFTAVDRLVALDAQATLGKITVEGEPDWKFFKDALGPLIERVSHHGRVKVHAYGEMVNLLWQEGKQDQALRLEGFWNDLSRMYSFSISCAFRIENLGLKRGVLGMEDVCRKHTHAQTAEIYDAEAKGTVLIADDDDDDFEFIESMFREIYPRIRIVRARNGEEVMGLLKEARPDFLLLDLNMPLQDGRETLSQIRRDRELDRMPVIVFTTSTIRPDENFVDSFQSAYFFSKPVGYAQYREFVRSLVSRHLSLTSYRAA